MIFYFDFTTYCVLFFSIRNAQNEVSSGDEEDDSNLLKVKVKTAAENVSSDLSCCLSHSLSYRQLCDVLVHMHAGAKVNFTTKCIMMTGRYTR